MNTERVWAEAIDVIDRSAIPISNRFMLNS